MPRKTYRKDQKVYWDFGDEEFTVVEDFPQHPTDVFVKISDDTMLPGHQLARPEELELCS